MKVLVNYVVQGEKEPRHQSEILDISDPPYTYLFYTTPPVDVVLNWLAQKQSNQYDKQQLILTSMYKF
jgi:hypothetical protein